MHWFGGWPRPEEMVHVYLDEYRSLLMFVQTNKAD